jgi:hypothetical protein
MRDLTTDRAQPTRAAPVFVDDSGRRRRLARVAGGAICLVVCAYLALVGLTLTGAPGTRHLSPPGLDALARPAGGGSADVGAQADEQPLPVAADAPAAPGGEGGAGIGAAAPGAPRAPSTVTTAPAEAATSTTTTTVPAAPGQGSTTSVPTPNSTVPAGGHGPPSTRPGQL